MEKNVTIIGTGQAGLQVALSLRQGGFEGGISMYGKEPHLPYQRPPLSKQVLSGEWNQEKCKLRGADFLREQGIEVMTGRPVTGLDCKARKIRFADGSLDAYDSLVICTGAAPNRLTLPGADLAGVHYLRTLDDALDLHGELARKPRIVIIGGGYIGLEVAATARSLGCPVQVVEAMPGILQRSALKPLQQHMLAMHRENDVRIHLGRTCAGIDGDLRVSSVTLDDGTKLEAGLVLAAIGVHPDIDWLDESGLATARGLLTDVSCRTSADRVYAAGDVCESDHGIFGKGLLFESVQNAVSQARIVAANILGEDQVYDEVPWFWSQQYKARIQMAGIPQQGDRLVVRDAAPGSLSVLSIGPGRLNAIQVVNSPADYVTARKLIAMGGDIGFEKLENPETDLRSLL